MGVFRINARGRMELVAQIPRVIPAIFVMVKRSQDCSSPIPKAEKESILVTVRMAAIVMPASIPVKMITPLCIMK